MSDPLREIHEEDGSSVLFHYRRTLDEGPRCGFDGSVFYFTSIKDDVTCEDCKTALGLASTGAERR